MNIFEVPSGNGSRYFKLKGSAYAYAKRKKQPLYQLELVDIASWHIVVAVLNGINVVTRKTLIWAPQEHLLNIPKEKPGK